MSSTYLEPFDRASPPHVLGADGGTITEQTEPSRWTSGQRLLADWYAVNAVDGLVPPEIPIDPLSALMGSIHKISVDHARDDFRYLIYGRRVSYRANMGMEGKWVSDLVEPARSIFLAHYRDLASRPRLFVGTLRYSGKDVAHGIWLRAVAPVGGSGSVTRFIVYTTTVEEHVAEGPVAEGPVAEGPVAEGPATR